MHTIQYTYYGRLNFRLFNYSHNHRVSLRSYVTLFTWVSDCCLFPPKLLIYAQLFTVPRLDVSYHNGLTCSPLSRRYFPTLYLKPLQRYVTYGCSLVQITLSVILLGVAPFQCGSPFHSMAATAQFHTRGLSHLAFVTYCLHCLLPCLLLAPTLWHCKPCTNQLRLRLSICSQSYGLASRMALCALER